MGIVMTKDEAAAYRMQRLLAEKDSIEAKIKEEEELAAAQPAEGPVMREALPKPARELDSSDEEAERLQKERGAAEASAQDASSSAEEPADSSDDEPPDSDEED